MLPAWLPLPLSLYTPGTLAHLLRPQSGPGPQHGHVLRLKSQASHCNDDCSFIFREMTHLLLLL